MATVPTQVRIDEELKKQSMELFAQLGIDMSSAMNMFLKQCVMRGGYHLQWKFHSIGQRFLKQWKKQEELAKTQIQRDIAALQKH